MTPPRRWDPCVTHRAQQTARFIAEFFKDSQRRTLLVAGAGFDPRSTTACQALAAVAGKEITGAFIREERPDPNAELIRRAEANLVQMKSLVGSSQELVIQVFASDGAVIGGRTATHAMRQFTLSDFTDVIVDLSALSVGVAYPLVRYFFQTLHKNPALPNLHLLVTDEPITDTAISATASDRVGTVHGFQGGLGLDKNAGGVKLWLPQLVNGKRAVLEKIRSYVDGLKRLREQTILQSFQFAQAASAWNCGFEAPRGGMYLFDAEQFTHQAQKIVLGRPPEMPSPTRAASQTYVTSPNGACLHCHTDEATSRAAHAP